MRIFILVGLDQEFDKPHYFIVLHGQYLFDFQGFLSNNLSLVHDLLLDNLLVVVYWLAFIIGFKWNAHFYKMILTFGGMFLFNLLCGLVPCDPKYKSPEVLEVPTNSLMRTRNVEKRNVAPIVETKYGFVEGYFARSTVGKEFFAFEGIPYGESTAGHQRWKVKKSMLLHPPTHDTNLYSLYDSSSCKYVFIILSI